MGSSNASPIFVRVQTIIQITFFDCKGDFEVRVARREDLDALYRLRYDCFYKEYLDLPDEVVGYDINRFDLFANYLVVTDLGKIVATYRIIEGKRPWDFSFSESFRVRNFKTLKSRF
jgi:putative hemolysin